MKVRRDIYKSRIIIASKGDVSNAKNLGKGDKKFILENTIIVTNWSIISFNAIIVLLYVSFSYRL